jgi:hypothetical protein
MLTERQACLQTLYRCAEGSELIQLNVEEAYEPSTWRGFGEDFSTFSAFSQRISF